MKQTAVEWLLEEFKNFTTNAHFDRNGYIIKIHKANMVDLINKAKEMEKEQHGKTWDCAIDNLDARGGNVVRAWADFDDFYNETYGGNK
jgi:hypothetical protein